MKIFSVLYFKKYLRVHVHYKTNLYSFVNLWIFSKKYIGYRRISRTKTDKLWTLLTFLVWQRIVRYTLNKLLQIFAWTDFQTVNAISAILLTDRAHPYFHIPFHQFSRKFLCKRGQNYAKQLSFTASEEEAFQASILYFSCH